MPRGLAKLIFNHADAWGLTLIIGAVCLVLHAHYTPRAILLVATLGICYWLGFAINDYFDAPYDALDPAKAERNFFVEYDLPPQQIVWPLAIIGLVLLQYGWRGLFVFCMGCAVMWAYSAPPLRLKSRAGFDLLTHMLFVQTFPYAVCLWLLPLEPAAFDWALLSFFLLGSLGAQLEQQARDYEVDLRTDPNFTSLVGLNTTTWLLRLVTALLIGNVLLHVFNGVIPTYLVPFAVIALPIMGHRFLRRSDTPRSERLVRATIVASLAYAGLICLQQLLF